MFLERILSPRNEVITTSAGLESFLRTAGVDTWAGEQINDKNALQLVTVWACVKIISEGIAKLPFFVFERDTSNPLMKSVPTTGDAGRINELLHFQPNDIQTSYEFREMLTGHAVLRGNGYAFINRVRGQIEELIPLNPTNVNPRVTENMDVEYILSSPTTGEQMVEPKENIFHLKGYSDDGVKGLSPVEVHRNALGENRAQQRHSSYLWGNRANPGGVLKHEGQLSEEAQERLRNQLDARVGGENAQKTLVLEEGMEWERIGLSSSDAQFLEMRKLSRSEIATIFGVKPHLVGDLDRAIQSNIEEQSRGHVVDTLLPWITRWESITRRDLLKEIASNLFAKLVVEGLLRGNSKDRADFYKTMVGMGIMTRNEARVFEDLNPIEGLDEPLTPLNMLEGSDEETDE